MPRSRHSTDLSPSLRRRPRPAFSHKMPSLKGLDHLWLSAGCLGQRRLAESAFADPAPGHPAKGLNPSSSTRRASIRCSSSARCTNSPGRAGTVNGTGGGTVGCAQMPAAAASVPRSPERPDRESAGPAAPASAVQGAHHARPAFSASHVPAQQAGSPYRLCARASTRRAHLRA